MSSSQSENRAELARQLDESPYAAAKEKFLDKYGYRDVQFWDLTTESKN